MTAPNRRLTLVIMCILFLLLGLTTSALGPMLPDLAGLTGTDLAVVGSLFTALFLGALLAQVAAGPLSDRIGQRPVLVGGLIMMSAGMLGLTFSPAISLSLAFAFLSGLGHGAIDLGGNVIIARVFSEKSAPALNTMNMFFGIGAFIGPALVSLFLGIGWNGLPAFWLTAALLVALMPFLLRMPAPAPLSMERSRADSARIYTSPLLWALGLLLLLYVGTETGVGGWTTTYMENTTGMLTERAALVASGFWLALTGGRFASAILGGRFSPFTVLSTSLFGAFAGGALLILGNGSQIWSIAAVLLIGFSFGPIYPTTMAITTSMFRDGPGKAASIAAAMGSIGGMFLPWLQGILLIKSRPSASAAFTAIGALAMLSLLIVIRIRLAQTTDRQAPGSLQQGSGAIKAHSQD